MKYVSRNKNRDYRSLLAACNTLVIRELASHSSGVVHTTDAAGPYYKRRCWALVCVAVWTYAAIYFAALYSYRLEALRLRRVIRGA